MQFEIYRNAAHYWPDHWITQTRRAQSTPFENGANNSNVQISLDKHDTLEVVIKAIHQLGYDLSEEDNAKVYEAFCNEASKKNIGAKELDAIIASTALQVPPAYKLISYVINSGNIINASANLQLERDGHPISGICVGDGPIDAAFLAIEQIVGRHYELDVSKSRPLQKGVRPWALRWYVCVRAENFIRATVFPQILSAPALKLISMH